MSKSSHESVEIAAKIPSNLTFYSLKSKKDALDNVLPNITTREKKVAGGQYF